MGKVMAMSEVLEEDREDIVDDEDRMFDGGGAVM